MNRRVANLICLLPILALVVFGCGDSTQAPEVTRAKPVKTSSPSQRGGTHVIEIAPVDESNQPVAGLQIEDGGEAQSCGAGSDSVGNAYRCFAGHSIYDPCWRDDTDSSTPAVVCQGRPWEKSATRLVLEQGDLRPFHGRAVRTGRSQPWGVELASGERCVALQGAHSIFPRPDGDGVRVVDYYCWDRAGKQTDRRLLRGIDRSRSLWRIDSASNHGADGYKVESKPAIVTAWYAAQEPATP